MDNYERIYGTTIRKAAIGIYTLHGSGSFFTGQMF